MAEPKNPLPSTPDPVCLRFTADELHMVDSAAKLVGESRSTLIRRIVITSVCGAVVEKATR